MTENIIFIFPETLEESLMAVSVMGQYLENRLVSNRDATNVHVVCPIRELHELLKACWWGITIDDKICSMKRNVADLVLEFDPERAYQVTKVVRKSIGDAYGILIGTQPMTIFPPVLQDFNDEPGLVLVVGKRHWLDLEEIENEWPEAQKFLEMGLEENIPIRMFTPTCSFKKLVTQVSSASVVVGIRSSATLLAATFNKIVIEISADKLHREWFAKWEAKKYALYRAEHGLALVSADVIWDRTKERVAQLARKEG